MARCSGSYLVNCGTTIGGMTVGQDCSAAGLVCAENAQGAMCATGTCDPTTFKPSCKGDDWVICSAEGGGLTTQSCSQGGTTCGLVNGSAECVGTGAACDQTTFMSTCDGTDFVSCTGGKSARFDCKSWDPSLTCSLSGGIFTPCTGAGTECTDSTSDSCANGVITYCMWGTTTTLDCTSYGLSGCTTSTNGGKTVAGCTQ
jgi:hypothetical protein